MEMDTFVTPDDFASEPEAKFAAEKSIRGCRAAKPITDDPETFALRGTMIGGQCSPDAFRVV
jgi:hypothetical protein